MKQLSFHNLIALLLFFSFSTNSVNAADINAGKNKATYCMNCHGKDGNSTSPKFPILAGQRAAYLEKQLTSFKSGYRESSIMKNMASKLNQEEIKNISAYFASLKTKPAGGDLTLAKKGQPKTAMCLGCHGFAAQGRGSFPKLAGQHPDYLKKQLLNFKNRSRKGGPMNGISKSLSEQTINEISAYLGNL